MIEVFHQLLGKNAVRGIRSDDLMARDLILNDAIAVTPRSAEECAAVLKVASEHSLSVVPWGGGQHQACGNLPLPADVVLMTQEMNGVVDHDETDQTMVVDAGTPLVDVQAQAKKARQFLPLDPPGMRKATVGGVAAAAVSGPLRTGYGVLRDYLLGTHAAHPDGEVTKSGGRLVKNVTGFDLHRLYHGSLGTLAVLTRLNLRLLPLPEREATLGLVVSDLQNIDRFLEEYRRSGLVSAAFTLVDGATAKALDLPLPASPEEGQHFIFLRFHGAAEAVDAVIEDAKDRAIALRDAEAFLLEGKKHDSLWSLLSQGFEQLDPDREGTVLKISYLPMSGESSILGGLVESLVAVLAGHEQEAAVMVEPMLGIVRVGIGGVLGEETLAALTAISGSGMKGFTTIERAPLTWRKGRDVFCGSLPTAQIFARVKSALDPLGVLSPGRLDTELIS